MAKFFDAIPDNLAEFMRRQHMFFIATACSSGRINLSPKGMDTFRILGPNRVAYLDMTGSGNETATHLAVDGRATLMFCSFDDKPLILRLYGTGRSIRPGMPEWESLLSHFVPSPGQRQIIQIDVASLQTSCGFAVPKYELIETRTTLTDWAATKTPQELSRYWQEKNAVSIDGFPSPFTNESAPG